MASDRKRAANPPQFQFVAFELSEPDVLGPPVRLEIAPRKTVLVGRNGAGKSAVLEGIAAAIRDALAGRPRHAADVRNFRCDLRSIDHRHVSYEFTRRPAATGDADPARTARVGWTERCWYPDTEEVLWGVKNSTATFANGQTMLLQPGHGLLSVALEPNFPLAPPVTGIRDLFTNVGNVQAGVPRTRRHERVYVRADDAQSWSPAGERDRIDVIALLLLRWHAKDEERFAEFQELGRRMGVWRQVGMATFKAMPLAEGSANRQVAIVSFDDTNIGLLADGTLRIAEILVALLRPAASLLLVEEPETSIHPGLLARLLAEIDSYSTQCPMVMTTHSPQVVAASKPKEVRLVHREAQRTTIRNLTDRQLARVGDYLSESGTLGEFVFGGGADE